MACCKVTELLRKAIGYDYTRSRFILLMFLYKLALHLHNWTRRRVCRRVFIISCGTLVNSLTMLGCCCCLVCSYSIRRKGNSTRQNQDSEGSWRYRRWVSCKDWICHAWCLQTEGFGMSRFSKQMVFLHLFVYATWVWCPFLAYDKGNIEADNTGCDLHYILGKF